MTHEEVFRSEPLLSCLCVKPIPMASGVGLLRIRLVGLLRVRLVKVKCWHFDESSSKVVGRVETEGGVVSKQACGYTNRLHDWCRR